MRLRITSGPSTSSQNWNESTRRSKGTSASLPVSEKRGARTGPRCSGTWRL